MTLIPPQPVGVPPGSSFWNDWIEKIRFVVNNLSNGLLNHNDLQNIQGGSASERYHLTNAQLTDLTDSGDSTLHFHSADRNSTNFTGTNWTDLTDSGDTTLHFHANDRARGNHTGTQLMSTISDLPTIAHGTYTPTLTNVSNLDSSTSAQCQYLRVGNTVVVSGGLSLNPTTTATMTQLGISLPISSNFSSSVNCGGSASSIAVAGMCAGIYADVANDRAMLEFIASDTNDRSMYFTFTYQII